MADGISTRFSFTPLMSQAVHIEYSPELVPTDIHMVEVYTTNIHQVQNPRFGFSKHTSYGRMQEVHRQVAKKLAQAPKKKVSVHSQLSSTSLGMLLLCCSLLWSPGVNQFGIFQFTDQFRSFSASEETLAKITSILTALVAITGQYRIPKNSPACRRLMFEYSTCIVIGTAALLLSNIGGMTASFVMFDAWSVCGGLAILAPMIGAFLTAFRMLDDSIAGPIIGTV